MSEELLVVSPCYCHEHGSRMMRTARRNGLTPVLTDIGVVSDGHNGNVQFYNLMPWLEARPEKYVLHCDCMDVAWLAGEEEILAKFKAFNSLMVVSADKDQLSGMGDTGEILARTPGYLTNLNIGLWIGEREYAIHTIRESYRLYFDKPAIANYRYNSPQAWMNLMLAHGGGPEFTLDRDCVLFQSMTLGPRVNDIVMEGKRAHNTVTDTYPVALHYNGRNLEAYGQMVDYLLT